MVEAEIAQSEGAYILFRNVPPKIPLRRIMEAVCAHRGLTLAELLVPDRTKYAARSRQMVMWLADQLRPDLSLRTVARILGRTDHTTVYHGILQTNKQIQSGCPYTINTLVEASRKLGMERIDMTGRPRCRLTETAQEEREARRRRKNGWTA